ncbi:hypothetical protein NE237_032478 [Protea cynaroides]|uniref:Uncharacterized protein n=1 Tax=Protea cynaroides TaxID=273540 RepID=A0A9Q0L3K0_9MAGN|nr:hypothetical protein NE237_032478 [Protea cynaroides]
MPVQVSFSGIPPSGLSHAESMAYGYSGAVRTTLQQSLPPLHNIQRQQQLSTNQRTFGMHLNEGSLSGAGPHPPQPQGQDTLSTMARMEEPLIHYLHTTHKKVHILQHIPLSRIHSLLLVVAFWSAPPKLIAGGA